MTISKIMKISENLEELSNDELIQAQETLRNEIETKTEFEFTLELNTIIDIERELAIRENQ